MLNNALFYYMMELISVISLRKIFQNTGLRFSSFPRLRIYDSVLIRKNAGLRKPLYWQFYAVATRDWLSLKSDLSVKD